MLQRSIPVFRAPARGAVLSKLAIAMALGAGVLWAPIAALFSSPNQSAEAPAPVATASTPLPATAAALPQTETAAPAGDPFAGVDVGRDPVLRHIAGIEEPKRASPGEGAAPKAAAAPAPARAATAVPITEARSTVAAPAQTAPAPVVEEARPVAPAPAAARDIAPAAQATAPATAPARVANESPAKTAPEREERAAMVAALGLAPSAAPSAEPERVAVARTDPSPAPAATAASVTPPRAVRRTVPTFPNEAIKAGIKTGRVLARVNIDGEGKVSESQIISARPPGYFEKESQRALSAWRYEATGRTTSTEVELQFSRE